MDVIYDSHYESVVENETTELKNKIFKSMAKLEGWCSETKASILVDMILLTKPEVVVEIGVWGGKSLIPMAYALQTLGKGKAYGIDPWSADASAVGMDGVNLEWWTKVDHEMIYQGVVKSIKQFGLQKQIVLVRNTSENADLIQNIGLLHIDGNHAEETSYLDVTKWVPCVKKGGIIIFDDVNWSTTNSATAWLDENCIKITELKGDNIWGIWVKK